MDERQCEGMTRSGHRCKNEGRPLCGVHDGSRAARRELRDAALRATPLRVPEALMMVGDLVEVERVTHAVDPDSELGRAMAKAREAGIMAPGDFDEGSIRPTTVTE